MSGWEQRLAAQLAPVTAGLGTVPPEARLGAALVLLCPLGDDLELVYTRRRDDLPYHPGQVSFPGGRVEEGETVVEAALREAAEEVGLDLGTVTPLGLLPGFFIPPSRFWLQGIVARWDNPHPLVAEEREVAAILPVRVSALRDPANWRGVRLRSSGWSWAWQLDERHLLWGATAVLTTMLLGLLDPEWAGGSAPSELEPDRIVDPVRSGTGPR